MDYLVYKLAWWLVAAFVIGLAIGWVSCSGPRGDRARGSGGE